MNNYFLLLISILQFSASIVFFIHKEIPLGIIQLCATTANICMFLVGNKI